MLSCSDCKFKSEHALSPRCGPCYGNDTKPNFKLKDPWEGQVVSDKFKPGKTDNATATVGLRFNNGKRRFDLIPPDGLAALADLFTIGSRKYAERNWELGMKYSNVYASLERHYQAWKAGEDRDGETGQLHMIHVCWNALVLATYQLRGIGEDDRKKVTMPEPV